jgi:gamma-glutamyl-gamma-aminobutyrate hydrolase PuuD
MLQNEEIGGFIMLIALPTSSSKTQYYINQAYVDYVKEAGFTPLMVTPHNDPTEVANICDGIILPGGIDIDPIYYNEDNWSSYSVDPEKDAFERAMFWAFGQVGKPIFGICRGFQLIIREYMLAKTKATKRLEFLQHINRHSLATDLSISRSLPAHRVSADRNVLYGEEHKMYQKMFVNSMHHQCLILSHHTSQKPKRPLSTFNFTALAYTTYGRPSKEKDYNIVEAFELTSGPDWMETGSRVLAVQWHPEEMKDYALIQTFFNQDQEIVQHG